MSGNKGQGLAAWGVCSCTTWVWSAICSRNKKIIRVEGSLSSRQNRWEDGKSTVVDYLYPPSRNGSAIICDGSTFSNAGCGGGGGGGDIAILPLQSSLLVRMEKTSWWVAPHWWLKANIRSKTTAHRPQKKKLCNGLWSVGIISATKKSCPDGFPSNCSFWWLLDFS